LRIHRGYLATATQYRVCDALPIDDRHGAKSENLHGSGLIALQKKPYIAGDLLSLANVTLSSFRTAA
jgi:hypothetical protein